MNDTKTEFLIKEIVRVLTKSGDPEAAKIVYVFACGLCGT